MTRSQRGIRITTVAALTAALLCAALPANAISRIDLENRIASLRKTLDKLTTSFFDAEQTLDESEEAVTKHTRALGSAGKRLDALAGTHSRRTAELYISGSAGVMNTLVNATSIDVFAERLGYLERIRSAEQGSLETLIALRRRAAKETKELAAARGRASGALRLLTERRKSLDAKLREYQSLLGLANLTSGRLGARASRGKLPGFRCPVAGPHGISSNFGARRRGGPHKGIDLAANSGTPLVAVLASRVVDVVRGGWMGRGVIIRDASGNEWWYAHLSSSNVERGESLAAGQVLGRVGCTGNCTGPHLHFEYHPGGGDPRNPYKIVRAAC